MKFDEGYGDTGTGLVLPDSDSWGNWATLSMVFPGYAKAQEREDSFSLLLLRAQSTFSLFITAASLIGLRFRWDPTHSNVHRAHHWGKQASCKQSADILSWHVNYTVILSTYTNKCVFSSFKKHRITWLIFHFPPFDSDPDTKNCLFFL